MTTEDSGNPVPPAGPTPPAGAQPQQPYDQQAYGQQPFGQQPYGQPAQPAYYGTQPGYGQPMPPRGLSIASMVCGIVGLVLSFLLMGFLPALAGVVLGHIGIKREPTAKGFAITGLITGYAGIALALVILLITLAAVFIPLLFVGTAASSGYLNS